LVNNFRWGAGGLTLCLPAMKSSWPALWGQLYPMTGINSTVALGWNGSVTAHCRKRDAAVLQTMRGSPAADPAGLEKQVAGAMSAAWQYLRAGNINLAERAVGQIPDAEIFVVPTHRIRASRWLRAVFIVIAAMCLMLLVGGWLFQERLSGMKPVNLTEAQVRAFLSMITTNPNPIIGNEQEGYPYDPGTALFDGLVLPSTNLFPPAGLRGMRDAVAGNGGFELLKQQGGQAQWVFGAPLARHAVADGWIGWSDLEIQPSDAAAFLRKSHYMNLPDQWQEWFLTRCGAWSWVKQERFEVKRIQLDGLSSLRLLRDVNCLDLVPREKLIQQIASVQVLSATPTTDKPPIHDWRDVRGLFFTPGFPALQDTYYSLAALEILGGLDRIDREACIRGILGRHEGRGFFTSPSSGSYNEYDIDGSVHDSVAAFESLRILGALDRVKDLDRWQFRVASYNASTPDTNGVRTLTWEEVEAWVCQQRLAKIVEERREHPGAPVRSLLEP